MNTMIQVACRSCREKTVARSRRHFLQAHAHSTSWPQQQHRHFVSPPSHSIPFGSSLQDTPEPQQPLKSGESPPLQVHVTHSTRQGLAPLVDPNRDQVSRFVDQLLARTRELMGKSNQKFNNHSHSQNPTPKRHHIIAYSGGVDSSLVAALVHQSQGDDDHVRAILGLSPAVPKEQVELAERVAREIGIHLSMIQTTEGEDETYISNAGQACLACKTNLYSSLQAVFDHVADGREVKSQQSALEANETAFLQMYNGTNANDLEDPTRLGLIAAQNFAVRSPLQHITKAQVRIAARFLGLPNWNYAASPCLRSRLALGVPATADHLYRIEEAERYVKQRLHSVLNETSNLRVRLLSRNRARIELDADQVENASQVEWDEKFVKELGFSSVSVQAFRSGSVASPLKEAIESADDNAIARVEDKREAFG